MADDNQRNLIIDFGSETCKIGFSNEEEPRMNAPCFYYTDRNQDKFAANILSPNNTENINQIFPQRKVQNWELFTQFFQYLSENELSIKIEDNPLLLNLSNKYDWQFKTQTAEIFFEQFKVPMFYLCSDSLLGLYSNGATTGIVFESGHHHTKLTPIYQGQIYNYAEHFNNINGNFYTQKIQDTYQLNYQQAKFIKDNNMRISFDYEQELQQLNNPFYKKQEVNPEDLDEDQQKEYPKNVELPDGKSIELKDNMIQLGQSLFYPEQYNLNHQGIQESIYDTLTNCSMEFRREMISNVVMTGGTLNTINLKKILKKQLDYMIPMVMKAKLLMKVNPIIANWRGGSILSNLGNFNSQWITKQEYDDQGFSALQRKVLQLTFIKIFLIIVYLIISSYQFCLLSYFSLHNSLISQNIFLYFQISSSSNLKFFIKLLKFLIFKNSFLFLYKTEKNYIVST